MSPPRAHNMMDFGALAAEICWRVWGTSANLNGFRVLVALLRGTHSGCQPNFAALHRRRQLYSAGQPSRWALAHILVCFCYADATIASMLTSVNSMDCK